jgi:hypothetical protein
MKTLASTLLLTILVGGTAADADGRARHVTTVSLSELRETPAAYLNVPVSFTARFSRLTEVYQPFFTPFDSFSFANFAAWDCESDLKSQEQFLDHCPTLYIDRRMRESTLEKMNSLDPYECFRATGVVRQVFAGRPFIEITDVKPVYWWKFWMSADDHAEEAFGQR